MEIFLNDGEIHLTENSPLCLRNAAGQGITCTSGTIWITVTGNARDIFLEPGESYRVQGNGLALVEAIGAGSIQICRKENFPAVRMWIRRLRELFRRRQITVFATPCAQSADRFPARRRLIT